MSQYIHMKKSDISYTTFVEKVSQLRINVTFIFLNYLLNKNTIIEVMMSITNLRFSC